MVKIGVWSWFSKQIRLIRRAWEFLTGQLWSVELDDYPLLVRRLLHMVRVVLLAMRGFTKNSVQVRASALSYYTLLSLVPVAALAFGVAKGFGMDDRLDGILREQLAAYPAVADKLVEFATSLLDRTGGGVVAGVGVIILLWTVAKVLKSIEDSFNVIWQIDKSRGWLRRFSDYFAVMLIAPVVILVASSANVYAQSLISRAAASVDFIGTLQPYLMFLLRFSPYVLVPLVFVMLYLVMPNTRVKVMPALIAGLVAGVGFVLLQWAYIYFQFGVSRYNAIYGSFAALPLFLMWSRLSWLIVLFGAELSFAVQNVRLYEFERETINLSSRRTKELSLLLLSTIVTRFKQSDAPLTAEELGQEHGLPIRLTRRLLHWMTEVGLIIPAVSPNDKEYVFQPAHTVDYYTVGAVLHSYENYGTTIDAKGAMLALIESYYSEYTRQRVAHSPHILSLVPDAGGSGAAGERDES